MTLEVELTPVQMAALKAEARRGGTSLPEALIARAFPLTASPSDDAAARRARIESRKAALEELYKDLEPAPAPHLRGVKMDAEFFYSE